jgi:hypothetical protein
MTSIADIREGIKAELGWPTISLYIKDDNIDTLIQKAVRKCSDKACPTFTVKRSVINGSIDLSGLDVSAVKNIYEEMTSTSESIFDLEYQASVARGLAGMGGSNDYLGLIAQIGEYAQDRYMAMPDYYLDGDKLYIDNYQGTVTVEYVKKSPRLEDYDSEWAGWVEGYALALVKMAEGRIRGKFRLNNGPFELDGDTLVSEGSSDKMDLESKLDLSPGYFNVLR